MTYLQPRMVRQTPTLHGSQREDLKEQERKEWSRTPRTRHPNFGSLAARAAAGKREVGTLGGGGQHVTTGWAHAGGASVPESRHLQVHVHFTAVLKRKIN